jgi:1-deoxy-D-xylulose-5-phosphate reductoisomerase
MDNESPLQLAVLGSTGSVGRQALDVVREHPDKFKVVALAAATNTELLLAQIAEFRPAYVAISKAECGEKVAAGLKSANGTKPEIVIGKNSAAQIAAQDAIHAVVAAVSGFDGLDSVLVAVDAGKDVALANKESLVAAGSLLKAKAAASGALIAPVDSEHNSIFQCLPGSCATSSVRRIIITASGGPFLTLPLDQFSSITPAAAIKHPRWNMGAKISVDSATLMNKGLEVIEAAYLFDLPPNSVEVLIHPQSTVHGLVEYVDGTVLAAVYSPDMRVPIANALACLKLKQYSGGTKPVNYGSIQRLTSRQISFLDLVSCSPLEFIQPDYVRFPALRLAYQALESGGLAPAVLNAANEVAVSSFLQSQLGFNRIIEIVEQTLAAFNNRNYDNIGDVVDADQWARRQSKALIEAGCTRMVS